MKNCKIPLIIAMILGYSVHGLGIQIFNYFEPSQPDVNEIEIKILEFKK